MTSPSPSYIKAEGVSYLGKDVCVFVPVSETAEVSVDGRRSGGGGMEKEVVVGVELKVEVMGKRATLKDGACSVLHVV